MSKVFQIAVRGGGIFFTGWREPEEEWFWWFKITFCEYWKPKSKHDLCVQTVWDWNKNGAGAMPTAKNAVFIGL